MFKWLLSLFSLKFAYCTPCGRKHVQKVLKRGAAWADYYCKTTDKINAIYEVR